MDRDRLLRVRLLMGMVDGTPGRKAILAGRALRSAAEWRIVAAVGWVIAVVVEWPFAVAGEWLAAAGDSEAGSILPIL
jgi:hypothetical protein